MNSIHTADKTTRGRGSLASALVGYMDERVGDAGRLDTHTRMYDIRVSDLVGTIPNRVGDPQFETFDPVAYGIEHETLRSFLDRHAVSFRSRAHGAKSTHRRMFGADIRKHRNQVRQMSNSTPLVPVEYTSEHTAHSLDEDDECPNAMTGETGPGRIHNVITHTIISLHSPGRYNIGWSAGQKLALAYLSRRHASDTKPVNAIVSLKTPLCAPFVDIDLAIPVRAGIPRGFLDITHVMPNGVSFLDVICDAVRACSPTYDQDATTTTTTNTTVTGAHDSYAVPSYCKTGKYPLDGSPTCVVLAACGVVTKGNKGVFNKTSYSVYFPCILAHVVDHEPLLRYITHRLRAVFGSHVCGVAMEDVVDLIPSRDMHGDRSIFNDKPIVTPAGCQRHDPSHPAYTKPPKKFTRCTCTKETQKRPVLPFCIRDAHGTYIDRGIALEAFVLGSSITSTLPVSSVTRLVFPPYISDDRASARLPSLVDVPMTLDEQSQAVVVRRDTQMAHTRDIPASPASLTGGSRVDAVGTTARVDWANKTPLDHVGSPEATVLLKLLNSRLGVPESDLTFRVLSRVDVYHLTGVFTARSCRCMVQFRQSGRVVAHRNNHSTVSITLSRAGTCAWVRVWDYHCRASAGATKSSGDLLVLDRSTCSSHELELLSVLTPTTNPTQHV